MIDDAEAVSGRKIRSVYFECKDTTEQNNLDYLNEIVSETFELDYLPLHPSLEKLLDHIFKKS